MDINNDMCELRYWIERAAAADEPFSVMDYREAGVAADSTLAWCEASIPPQIAAEFETMGLGPEEAKRWGLIPTVVAEFLDLGFDADWARTWHGRVGFNALEAAAWRDAGLSVADAHIVCSADRITTAVLLQFALKGMYPTEAIASILGTAPTRR